jgi:hypothetical protein
VRVLAPICADRFQHSADVGANLAALMKADSWDRDDIITKAGWVTFPGSGPDPKVADASWRCSARRNSVRLRRSAQGAIARPFSPVRTDAAHGAVSLRAGKAHTRAMKAVFAWMPIPGKELHG